MISSKMKYQVDQLSASEMLMLYWQSSLWFILSKWYVFWFISNILIFVSKCLFSTLEHCYIMEKREKFSIRHEWKITLRHKCEVRHYERWICPPSGEVSLCVGFIGLALQSNWIHIEIPSGIVGEYLKILVITIVDVADNYIHVYKCVLKSQ